MSDGIDRKRIRRHLLIFSLAAPLMAIFTYALLKSVRSFSSERRRHPRLFLESARHLFGGLYGSGDVIQCGHISVRCHRSCSPRSSISLRGSAVSRHGITHFNHWLLFSNHSLHGTQTLTHTSILLRLLFFPSSLLFRSCTKESSLFRSQFFESSISMTFALFFRWTKISMW